MSNKLSLDKYSDIKINVKLARDAEVQELNKKFLNRGYTTDVLSFSMNEELDDNSYYLGDIIVNIDQARKQASNYDNDLEHEISQLVEHGVLHLLGVHHPDDDEHTVHGIKLQ